MTRRAKIAFLLALGLCLALSACAKQPQRDAQSASFPLPEPEAEADEMFLGESRGASRHDLTLYYLSSDGLELAPVPRTIYAKDNLALAEAAVQALFTTPGGGALPAGPTETQLLGVERTGGVYTVDLSVDARSAQGDQELYLMYAAISATLLEIDGAEGVNILIGGQSESVYRLPVGVLCGSSSTVVSALAQLQAESDRFLPADAASQGTIVRDVLLYYPSVASELLLPELRQVSFASSDYATALLEALTAEPETSTNCVAPLMSGVDALAEAPRSTISEWGTRLLELRFTADADAYLASVGLTRDQFAASLTLTLCSFVPELDGVRIYIGGELIERTRVSGAEEQLSDGVLTRALYSDSVGGRMTLFFAGDNGLRRVYRVAPQLSAVSPLQAVEHLFYGPIVGEDCVSALPAGISAMDVLGVSEAEGVVRVNLSGNFYRRCQTLDEAGERNAVYAIVNTLCQLDGVKGVQLCIEGSAADLLSESIYLRSVLLYNPGIIEEE